MFFFLARINKLLQTIDPVSRTSDNKYESAINKTVIMQGRISILRGTLKTLQKSYDDSLNQSQTSEILLNTKLGTSESVIRDQLENNMKQRLTSLDLRRQKLIEQSLNLLHRVEEMKIATNQWKSNLTSLSVGETGLTLQSSNDLRDRVTKISHEVKQLENNMKLFVNQMYKLQDVSKNFNREIKSLQLSVQDASQVCFFSIHQFDSYFSFSRKHKIYFLMLNKQKNKLNVQ